MTCVCVEECDWLRLGKFCRRQSTWTYFKGNNNNNNNNTVITMYHIYIPVYT